MVDRQVDFLETRRDHHFVDQILIIFPLSREMLRSQLLLQWEIVEQQLPAHRSVLLAIRKARVDEGSQSLHVDDFFVQNRLDFFESTKMGAESVINLARYQLICMKLTSTCTATLCEFDNDVS